MPPACPVEHHVPRYTASRLSLFSFPGSLAMATPLRENRENKALGTLLCSEERKLPSGAGRLNGKEMR